MIKPIIQYDDKNSSVLNKVCKPVPYDLITSSKIQNIIDEMFESLASTNNGVALSANQIGYQYRIFVISPKLKLPEDRLVYINPVIIKKSKQKAKMEEGCLSVKDIFGETKRHTNVTVKAYDREGNQFTRGAGGLLSQIFQHEIDHLNGKLFIDIAQNLQKYENQ